MSIKVILKGHRGIMKTTSEYNGVYDTLGVEYDEGVLKDNDFLKDTLVVESVKDYTDNNDYALLVRNKKGQGVYIHPSWVEYWNGQRSLLEYTELNEYYTQVTDELVMDYTTCTLIDIETMPLCSCGEIATHTMEDGVGLCNKCYSNLTKINNYSYRPAFRFIGKQLKADTDNEVWFGMELESSFDIKELSNVMHSSKGELYLKSDSSINGSEYNAEIVTHPHSFNALVSKDGLLEKLSKLNIEEDNSNGIHIHISRTSFVDDRHYSLFYFLLHEMHEVCTYIGGRELNSYCRLAPKGRVFSKTNKGMEEGSRSVFLNERNKDTVEARFFKATTDITRLKAYVQLINSMIKYTKYHNTKTSDGWYKYISKYSVKYKELLEVLGDYLLIKSSKVVKFKPPKTKTITLDNFDTITYRDMKNAISIVYGEEETFELDSIGVSGDKLYLYNYLCTDKNIEYIAISDLVSLTVLVQE